MNLFFLIYMKNLKTILYKYVVCFFHVLWVAREKEIEWQKKINKHFSFANKQREKKTRETK